MKESLPMGSPEFENHDFDIDVEALVAQEINLSKRSETFYDEHVRGSAEELLAKLDELPPEVLQGGFKNMIERLDAETDIVTEINDTIGKDNLLNGLTDAKYPVDVYFGENTELNPDEVAVRQRRGVYNKRSEVVRIADKQLDAAYLWIFMTLDFPDILKTLDHEIVHHWFNRAKKTSGNYQLDSFKDFLGEKFWAATYALAIQGRDYASKLTDLPGFEKVMNACWDLARKVGVQQIGLIKQQIRDIQDRTLIDEVVAQKAGRILDREDNSTLNLLRSLELGYDRSTPQDKDKIIVSSQIIDRLRVLGYSDKEIAIKLNEARWDDKTISFKELEEAITFEAEQKGMSAEDLDTAADVIRLEKKIDIWKSTVIAQEELAKLIEIES